MTSAIIITSDQPNTAALIRPGDVKDVKSRLAAFVGWLNASGGTWYAPDMAAYRDHLQHERGLSPSSALAHLSTIRGRYKLVMEDNSTRDLLYAMTPDDTAAADRKAFVDELITRLENAVNPARASVTIITQQDTADSAHVRLTIEQANALLAAPGLRDIQGLRDTALIALMLVTGLREMEACAVQVDDLRQRLGGALALRVREGKGAKGRLIPYGAGEWALAYVEKWLALAGITSGAVFRAFYKPRKGERPRVRPAALSVRAVQDILDRYPVIIDGTSRTINPHDLRRTYARRLFDVGVDPVAIQQNMGHSDLKTTLGYIGNLDASQRRPPALFTPPHIKALDRLTML